WPSRPTVRRSPPRVTTGSSTSGKPMPAARPLKVLEPPGRWTTSAETRPHIPGSSRPSGTLGARGADVRPSGWTHSPVEVLHLVQAPLPLQSLSVVQCLTGQNCGRTESPSTRPAGAVAGARRSMDGANRGSLMVEGSWIGGKGDQPDRDLIG